MESTLSNRSLAQRLRREYESRYRKQRVACGLCERCGGARGGGKLKANVTICSKCSDKVSATCARRREKYRAEGRCINCGKIRTDGSLCLDCRIKSMYCLRFRKPIKNGEWLLLKEKLLRQGFKCAYSGKEIMPGANASLDHIVPVSRGGTDDIWNIHWLDLAVNKMKGALMPEEFFALCAVIAKRAELS